MKKFLLLFAFLLNFLNLNAQYSTLGNDFWVSFMQNYNVPANCIIYITSPQGATGTVSMPGSGWSQNFTVGANASIGIQIPAAQNPNIENSNVVLNKGVHVVSNNPIAVYAANQRDASSDATLVLPVQALGDQYMIMSYTVLSGYPSEFIIIGVENNTSIQIIPKAAVIGGVGANVPFNITLNAGEVYMVQSNGDLTGSTVKATNLNTCNNFAVFAGNRCANVPTTCSYCDHLYEQMLPLKTWGKNYITSPLMTRSSDQFRILAMENSTSIQINGGTPINLNAGQYYETSLSQASFITSNNPISVAQYSKGTSCDNVTSDPFMIILSPVEQFIDNIVFQAFSTSVINQFYTNIITKTANTNLVTLDGSTLTGWSTVPSNNLFSYIRRNINQGTHILYSDSGLTAIVYGFGNVDSYGYLAGANVKALQIDLSIVINNDTIPYSLFHDTICNNQLITFIADTSSQIYNIHWDFGDGNTANGVNISHSYQSSGTYNLTMYFTRPESCMEDSISTILTINDISVQITPNNPQICIGNSIVLNGSGASSYSWSTGDNTASITVTPSATTTYTVTGSNGVGCSNTATVAVTVGSSPTINITASPSSICSGGTSVLTASGGSTYSWSTGGSTSSITVTPSATTTYTVTGSSGVGCSNTATVTVTVGSLATINVIASPTSICTGGTSVLTASGANTYSWSTGESGMNITVSPTSTTTYTLTGINSEGCSGTATITVTVHPLPTINYTTIQSHCGLPNGSIITNINEGIPPYVYQWSNGANSGNLDNITAGNYNLTVTDNNGCSSSISITLTEAPMPEANFAAKPQITTIDDPMIYFENYSTGASFYEWDFGDGNISSYYSPTHTYEYPGIYHVVLTASDQYGCIDTAGANIIINDITNIFLPNAFTPNGNDINELYNIMGTGINPNTFEMRIF
ncbi:MAG: PKD domain-containing protein, partial [Bacteroidales bacterium]|nr:PKD domain-containing protein [Bacteroidales bacterium]